MENRINKLKEKFFKLSGEKEQIENRIKELDKDLKNLNSSLEAIEQAQIIIQDVALQLQNSIKYHIEDIVNLALNYVFPNEYEFVLDFFIRRNQTECEFWLKKGDVLFNPLLSNGGGVVDILSFALRIALWSLKVGEKNNTIILDEPFRFVSSDLQAAAGEILQELSEKLDLQFIIVTHETQIIEIADKLYKVEKNKGISSVKEL